MYHMNLKPPFHGCHFESSKNTLAVTSIAESRHTRQFLSRFLVLILQNPRLKTRPWVLPFCDTRCKTTLLIHCGNCPVVCNCVKGESNWKKACIMRSYITISKWWSILFNNNNTKLSLSSHPPTPRPFSCLDLSLWNFEQLFVRRSERARRFVSAERRKEIKR